MKASRPRYRPAFSKDDYHGAGLGLIAIGGSWFWALGRAMGLIPVIDTRALSGMPQWLALVSLLFATVGALHFLYLGCRMFWAGVRMHLDERRRILAGDDNAH